MTTGTTVGGLTYPQGSCPSSCPPTTNVSYNSTQNWTSGVVANLQSQETLSCPPYGLQVSSTVAAATVFALPTSTQSNPQQYILYNGNYNPNDSTIANPYGLVNELVYPDGGWVKYTWKMSNSDPNNPYAQSAFFSGNGMLNGTPDGNTYPQGCALKYNTPVLATRTVSFDGVTVAQTQTFTYQTTWSGWGWTSKQTSVVTTDNIAGNSFLTVYNYGAGLVPGSDPLTWGVAHVASGVPTETSILYYSGNSTSTPLLRTVTKSWYDVFDPAEVDTTENGLTAKTVYCYVGTSCNPTTSLSSPFYLLKSKSEYDFTGALIRATNYQYQNFPYNTITVQSSPVTLPVPPRPSSVTITNSGGTVAETDYAYDGASIGSATGVQHDDSNYGAGLTNRGNPTSVTHKCIGCTNPTTTYTYDITGQLTSMTDPKLNKTTYSFADSPTGGNSPGQSNAYLTQVTYPKTGSIVHQESFQYNYVFGDLTQSTDENGQITTYAYVDPFDRLTKSSFPDGGITNVSYTDSPTSPSVATCELITGSAGAACSAASPPTGWKVGNSLMDGMFHSKQTQLPSDPDGEDYVDISFDGLGRNKTVSNPHRAASASTDGTSSTTYDALGRPTLVTEQDGSTVQTEYDQTCNTNTNTLGTTVIDEAGHQRTSCTDGLGRLVEVDEPGVAGPGTPGQGTVLVDVGTLQCTSDGHGGYYPDSGTLWVTVNGVQVNTGYGGSCNGTTQTLMPTADQMATTLASELTGSSAGVTASDIGSATIQITATTTGSNTNYPLSVTPTSGPVSLSASGATLTGGTGNSGSTIFVTLYNYDALGNLLCVEQHGGVPTSYGCSSPPSDDINSQWRIRRFSYDSLSRLLTAENPETGGLAGKITYTYDANSNLASKMTLSPNQPPTGTQTVTTSYTYDALNRLTGKLYADGYSSNPATPPVQYGYDGVALAGCAKAPPSLTDSYPIGRRTSMCDGSSSVPGSGSTSWSHDQMGRVLVDKRYIGSVAAKWVTYVYNLDGSTSKVTAPDFKTVTYTVGGAGRPLSAMDGSNDNYVKSATYAPPGELQTLTDGGVIYRAFSYNSRLQPLQVFYGTNTPPTLTGSTCPNTVGNIMHRVYAFNFGSSDNGNVMSIANCRDTTRTQSFTYDVLNRIASAQSSGTQWGETFTIDPWGNLTNEAGISGKTNHEGLNTGPATNQNQLSGFGYDDIGNMISNGGTTYIYDAENRLVWTTGGYRYLYDGDGNRVEKCVAGSATTPCPTSGTNGTLYWMGADTAALNESDLSGNILEQYVFFGGQRVARRDVSTNTVHYYFSDHLGTHTVVENAAGTACEQDIDYYPYGGQQNDYCPNVAQHYKFNGKERDTETGLDNFGARFDASSLGRFMTPDSKLMSTRHIIDPQKWNRYADVHNNPLAFVDPDGFDDFYVFLPEAQQVSTAWRAIQNEAPQYGNTVTIYPGKSASAEKFETALHTDGAHVIDAGHTVLNNSGEAKGVLLGDNKGVGDSSMTTLPDENGQAGGPMQSPGNVKANDVAVFGCDSANLQSHFSSTTFTGTQPITNTQAEDAGARTYTDTMVRGGTVDKAAGAAQGTMQEVTKRANQNPSKVMTYSPPKVCTTTNGVTTCH
jgi:RHS repeat-associated protein